VARLFCLARNGAEPRGRKSCHRHCGTGDRGRAVLWPDQPIEAECVNAGPKGSCERPRGFSYRKMKAARSPFFEAGGKRSRALARAEGALAAHPQERQHSAAEGGRRDRVRRTGALRECVATGVDGGNIR
jgi:hypothetical protein